MKEKIYVVMGLGVFGFTMAKRLQENGNYVIAIDNNEEKINEISELVSEAYIADVTNSGVLEDLGIKNADNVIISMGESLEATLISALKCKEFGVLNIIVKVKNEVHAQILRKIGVNKVIIPERDMALKIADHQKYEKFISLIELSEDYSIVQIEVPQKWIGKSIINLNIRTKYGINVICIIQGKNYIVNPKPEYEFNEEDQIMVLGENKNIEKL
ncbi:MAG: TrkA family potassium uptake protein [Peptoniphilaceae bacterium]|nr:TrkA family potassium uptake protein [Peptoniphilaceae bacterium]MDD7382905.1 TrkA family potassium uptake protein [Peptoniphilaceae bacterium]MDY3737656.1 TrkA family potassium uptake protein [Peptoniphilaceae bacterium]